MINRFLLPALAALVLCSCAVQRARDQVQADTVVFNEKIMPIQKKLFECVVENINSKNTQSCARTAILANTNAPWPSNVIDLKPVVNSLYESIYLFSLEYDAGKTTPQEYKDKIRLAVDKFTISWKETTDTTVENKYRASAGLPPLPKP